MNYEYHASVISNGFMDAKYNIKPPFYGRLY